MVGLFAPTVTADSDIDTTWPTAKAIKPDHFLFPTMNLLNRGIEFSVRKPNNPNPYNMSKENALNDQELRLETLELALNTVNGVELAKDANVGAEVVRVAKRYWKFIKNDPLAEKDETEVKAE